jgi:hypothetical protein
MNRTFDKDQLEYDDSNEIFHLEEAKISTTTPPVINESPSLSHISNSQQLIMKSRAQLRHLNQNNDSIISDLIENELIPDDLLDDIHNCSSGEHFLATPKSTASGSVKSWLASNCNNINKQEVVAVVAEEEYEVMVVKSALEAILDTVSSSTGEL